MISGKRTGEMKDALMTTVSLDPQSPPQFGDTLVNSFPLSLFIHEKIFFMMWEDCTETNLSLH